jgi:hypothetical protein
MSSDPGEDPSQVFRASWNSLIEKAMLCCDWSSAFTWTAVTSADLFLCWKSGVYLLVLLAFEKWLAKRLAIWSGWAVT